MDASTVHPLCRLGCVNSSSPKAPFSEEQHRQTLICDVNTVLGTHPPNRGENCARAAHRSPETAGRTLPSPRGSLTLRLPRSTEANQRMKNWLDS